MTAVNERNPNLHFVQHGDDPLPTNTRGPVTIATTVPIIRITNEDIEKLKRKIEFNENFIDKEYHILIATLIAVAIGLTLFCLKPAAAITCPLAFVAVMVFLGTPAIMQHRFACETNCYKTLVNKENREKFEDFIRNSINKINDYVLHSKFKNKFVDQPIDLSLLKDAHFLYHCSKYENQDKEFAKLL